MRECYVLAELGKQLVRVQEYYILAQLGKQLVYIEKRKVVGL